MPIRQVLESGDEVKILAAKNQKPNRDWLQFVVTSKAKSHIRQALKEQQAKEAMLGKELLMRRMKNWDIPFSDIAVRDLQAYFKFKQVHELYYQIGTDKIELNTIKEFFKQKDKEVEVAEKEVQPKQDTETEQSKTSKGIRIHRKKCPNAEYMISHYPYRVVAATWTDQGDSSYLINLKVQGTDEPGIVNRITKLLGETQRIQLRSINFSSKDAASQYQF